MAGTFGNHVEAPAHSTEASGTDEYKFQGQVRPEMSVWRLLTRGLDKETRND